MGQVETIINDQGDVTGHQVKVKPEFLKMLESAICPWYLAGYIDKDNKLVILRPESFKKNHHRKTKKK